MPRIAGGKDVITQPLYDTQMALAAGSNALTFFTTPLGSGATLFGAGPKNLTDSNMPLSGQLPSPWTFEIFTVQVMLDPRVLVADAGLLLNECNIQLNIGSKQFLQIPILHTPGGAGIAGAVAAAAGTLEIAANGWQSPGAVFKLSRSITLLENENFNMAMQLPTTPTPSVNTWVRVLLGGELSRSIQ